MAVGTHRTEKCNLCLSGNGRNLVAVRFAGFAPESICKEQIVRSYRDHVGMFAVLPLFALLRIPAAAQLTTADVLGSVTDSSEKGAGDCEGHDQESSRQARRDKQKQIRVVVIHLPFCFLATTQYS